MAASSSPVHADQRPGMIVFAAKVPGRIFPVEIAPGAEYVVHRHGWLCGTPNIQPTMAFQQTFGGTVFGGEGFLLQRLEGQGTGLDRALG